MKHNYFQDEKLKYEDIEIPDELLLMVRQTVADNRRKRALRQRTRILRTAGSIAAMLFLCLTIGVNSSYAFAETAVRIPVVKSVAKAMVVRSYRSEIIAVYEQNKTVKQKKEKPEAETAVSAEVVPEEAVPAVSGDDTISENEVPEQTEEQVSEEVPEGIDAWKAEMTTEKLREITEIYTPDMEERYADAPEKLRTILLAELPEKEISLYGYHENGKNTGVALLVKDTCRYFDWNYMNAGKKLPDMSYADIDGDGKEEIIILLYNGASETKEISGENIKEPETMEEKDTSALNALKTDTEDTKKAAASEAAQTGGEQETAADNTGEDAENEKPSVSGNEVKEPVEKEKPKQQPGEIWAVSLREESWTAGILSAEDYENQILRKFKAEFDESAGTVQLYLIDEAFGNPIKLKAEEKDKLTYRTVNLAPERKFIAENGLFLQFRMEAVFLDADGEKTLFPFKSELEAEIRLEGGTLIIDKIKKI